MEPSTDSTSLNTAVFTWFWDHILAMRERYFKQFVLSLAAALPIGIAVYLITRSLGAMAFAGSLADFIVFYGYGAKRALRETRPSGYRATGLIQGLYATLRTAVSLVAEHGLAEVVDWVIRPLSVYLSSQITIHLMAPHAPLWQTLAAATLGFVIGIVVSDIVFFPVSYVCQYLIKRVHMWRFARRHRRR